ncbi:MAG TPA: epimerase, partial [Vicinamibacteria bacterium]|nr:epimerase [Vicinamibacteria bacterium]
RYFARHYQQLAPHGPVPGLDFRALRFPGLISAFTVPSGGTSDYAAEMVHAAARGRPHACFVRPDTRIPFLTMPDAIDALLALREAPLAALTTLVYNVGGFSPSAGELAARVDRDYPGAQVIFAPDPRRQVIVDSWPEEVDDDRARRDWGWAPRHDLDRALDEYLRPNLTGPAAEGGGDVR